MNKELNIELKKFSKNFIAIIMSIISILGILSKFDIYNNKIIYAGNSFFYVIVCGMYFCFFKKIISKEDKRMNLISVFFSLILTIIYIISYFTSNFWIENHNVQTKVFYYFVVQKFLGVSFTSWLCIKSIYKKFENKNVNIKENFKMRFFSDNKISIVFVGVIIFIAYLPYIIYSFPGNMTYDFAIQIRQAFQYDAITNHHPYITTVLLRVILTIGKKFYDYNLGVFLYTFLQCILTCFVFSYSIYSMAKRNVNIKIRIFALVFYVLFPIFGFYSVWLTKDIIFTMCITMVTAGLCELCCDSERIDSKKYIIYMMIFMLLTMLFRKNGVYILILILPICLITYRKKWRKILIMFLIPIVLFKIIDSPIRESLRIKDGSTLEIYSIQAQQMARIYKYEKDSLSEQEKEKIEKYILDENIDYLYDPSLSDPVKAKFNEEMIKNDKKEFISFSLKLLFKYPKRTLESFACTTYRFYNIDNEVQRGLDQYKEQSVYVMDNMLPKEMNIKSNSKDIKFINRINDYLHEKDVPILSTLVSSGIYINLYIIFIGYLIYKKKYKFIISFLPISLVLLTQLAGPVVDQRYMYSAFTCFPILLALIMQKDEKDC